MLYGSPPTEMRTLTIEQCCLDDVSRRGGNIRQGNGEAVV